MKLLGHPVLTSSAVKGHCEGNINLTNKLNFKQRKVTCFVPMIIKFNLKLLFLESEAVVLEGLLRLNLFRVAIWYGSKEAKSALDIC